jgi:hypothetical protein
MSGPEPPVGHLPKEVLDAASDMLKAGLTVSAIERKLAERGYDARTASAAVKQAFRQRSRRSRGLALGNMIFGGLVAGGAGFFTFATYYSASMEGGTYFVAWGAVLYGLAHFTVGFVQLAYGLGDSYDAAVKARDEAAHRVRSLPDEKLAAMLVGDARDYDPDAWATAVEENRRRRLKA